MTLRRNADHGADAAAESRQDHFFDIGTGDLQTPGGEKFAETTPYPLIPDMLPPCSTMHLLTVWI